MTSTADIRLARASELLPAPNAASEIDAIFFSSSATQAFASGTERLVFREKWLGRYLDRWPHLFWLAVGPDTRVIGYLAGCLEDPAISPLFADHAYFERFAVLTACFPAHLHINVDATWRSAGVGARLIEAFCADAHAAGCPGVHVITAAGARNARFYDRLGFNEVGATDWNGRDLVMLGRTLAGS